MKTKCSVYFIFTAMFFLAAVLTSVGAQSAGKFNCRDLSGTFECAPTHGEAEMIEMDGQQITYIGSANIPLTLKLDGRKNETSSEQKHVKYSARCSRKAIEIKSNSTSVGTPTITEDLEATYTLDEEGDLATKVFKKGSAGTGIIYQRCARVVAE